ncbi:hypothetical protein SAMN05216215_100568 [Saccharopolyspora shandongensis]|uniref:Uncharacterized protein n=1 Tax=Saccharopolyspora shandongensis TaxID=418495 RepID=A0A1H2W6C1_9PSEU|nr:hypothetical protein SAMN05216215_100568 [Saccharopolyspora shandongensis]
MIDLPNARGTRHRVPLSLCPERAFGESTGRYRRELRVHCYRMLRTRVR